MRRRCTTLALALVLAMALFLVSTTAFAAGGSDLPYTYKQLGASSASVVFDGEVSDAIVSDEGLATVSVNGGTVNVTGIEGAVGTVTLTATCDGATWDVEVPLGYTTFVVDGDSLTVYPGSDADWSVSGIYAPDGSVSAKKIASVPNDDGSVSYANGSYDGNDYELLIELPKTGGSYVFFGESEHMAISVKKGATSDTQLLLVGLNLCSQVTSPLTIKKESTAAVSVTALAGHVNTLADVAFNNAELYGDTDGGGDGTNAEYAESAVIKGKSNAQLVLNGAGTLNLLCATKNAVKVGEYGSLTVEELTLNVSSANHGLSSDNALTIDSGTIGIAAQCDGIRSDPDTVDADAGCAGNITINGGDITIDAQTDGIQAAQDLTINGGSFAITTCGGSVSHTFNGDESSAKGLKASNNADDTSESTNTVSINGGSFVLDTADDAIHADGYVVITAGSFDIRTGDDAVHADTSLTLGVEGGTDDDLSIAVTTCYEGLEAGNVYLYAGSYDIVSSDDGINAAGGSDASDNPGQGFNPWGGPGRPGQPGQPGQPNQGQTGDYSINIAGGQVHIVARGDGIDSNGALNITGGTTVVWGGSGAENPLDYDGSFTIKGGTVLGVGYNQMRVSNPTADSQAYRAQSASLSQGKVLNVAVNSQTVFSLVAPQSASYVFFSSPSMSSASSAGIWVSDAVIDPDPVVTYPFSDLTAQTSHLEDILWLAENGISTGYDDGTFRGMVPVYRQDMAAFLYRLAGSPDYQLTAEDLATFADVDESTPHYREICWLASTGIAKGWTEGDGSVTFRGMSTVKRQDMAAFLRRLAALLGADVELGVDAANVFVDVSVDTPHYEDIVWLASAGISTGWTEGDGSVTFRGMNDVVRQDMAAFLHRLSDLVQA